MEYKIGDRVKVKNDLVGNRYYDCLFFAESMERYRGKIYRVRAFCSEPGRFRLDTDEPLRWKFNSAMVDPVTEIKFLTVDTSITELEF